PLANVLPSPYRTLNGAAVAAGSSRRANRPRCGWHAVRVAVEIEGGSLEHRRLLHAIFERFGPTVIRRAALGRHLVRAVPGALPTPEDARRASGVSLEVVEAAAPRHRVSWEAGLVARAFRAEARAQGLEQVVMVRTPKGGWALGTWTREPVAPLSGRELQQMADDVEAAALAADADV